MVATGLHHHRFLERPIVRVPITTLWQTGYTVKKCPPFGRPTLTSATKREQYSTAPERARIGWGKSHAGSGSLGDGPYSARGRCHSDTFTYANSQSGIVGKPKATRSLNRIPAVLLHSLSPIGTPKPAEFRVVNTGPNAPGINKPTFRVVIRPGVEPRATDVRPQNQSNQPLRALPSSRISPSP